MASQKQELLRLIEAESEEHVQFLQRLIQTPSPNPPGDTRDAIAVVQSFLQSKDVASEIIAPREDSPNLVSVFSGERSTVDHNAPRTIILNGHIDQFPVRDAEKWRRDPYSGDIEEGFVHGRSGVDMKAGTAATILAFAYLQRFRSQLAGQCVLEVVSDEETGGRWGTRYLIEDDERKDLWKGNCVLIGEPGGLQSIRIGEKGTLRMTITVTAQDGHGAYIHRSEGAIRIAARIIDRLVQIEKLVGEGMDPTLRDYLNQPTVRKIADEIMWVGAADSMMKPTVNIGTIRGGAKINMIPPECVFEVDIRIPIGMESKTVRAHIEKILVDFPEAEFSIHENHSHPSTYSPLDHELVSLIQRNAVAIGGEKPLPISSLGATDCKHFRRHNVPAYVIGPSPKGMGERDEKVSIDEFLYLVKVHAMTAWDYLQPQLK